jgi:hypothetical protein
MQQHEPCPKGDRAIVSPGWVGPERSARTARIVRSTGKARIETFPNLRHDGRGSRAAASAEPRVDGAAGLAHASLRDRKPPRPEGEDPTMPPGKQLLFESAAREKILRGAPVE